MSKSNAYYEAACVANGTDPNNLPDVSMLPEAQQKFVIGVIKLDAIIEHKNNIGLPEKWKPDYNNWSENKYFPRHTHSAGGVWLADSCEGWNTGAGSGVRPFRHFDIMIDVIKNCPDLYNDILNYTQN